MEPLRNPERPPLPPWSLAVLATLALAVRLPGAGRSLWYDELFTLERFAGRLGAALADQVAANNHPLASLLAWPGELAGAGEVGLRAPFVLLGAAAAPALAWGVARALGPATGWLAGALLAVAPSHVLWSQQVRGYAPMTAAACLATGLVLTALVRAPSRRRTAALAAATAVGVWAHLTLTAAIAAWLGLAALAAWRRWPPAGAARGLAAGLAGGSAAGLLLSAPVLRRTLKFVARNVGVPPAAGLHPGPLEPSAALTVAGGGSTSLAIALLLAAAVGIASLLRSRDRRLLGVALAAPLAAALALIAARALGYPRFLAFALPALVTAAAAGVVALARIARPGAARRAVGLGLATACVLPGVWRVAGDRSVELQDLRGACRRALGWSARLGGAPVVALGPGAQLLGRYLPGAQVDPAGALAGGPGRQVIVVPLPAWLESAPAVRARLLNGAPVIRVLPGRESAVLLVIRDPAAVDADR